MRRTIPLNLGLVGVCVALVLGVFIGTKLSGSKAQTVEKQELGRSASVDQQRSSNRLNTSSTQSERTHITPSDALEQALSEPRGAATDQAMLTIVEDWAITDTQAAFDWLSLNAEDLGTNLPQLYSAIMAQHIIQNPESAKEMISVMEAGSLKNTLAIQLVQSLAKEGVADALSWSESLEDPIARKQAVEVAVQAYTEEDPESAYQYASNASDPGVKEQMLAQVGYVMAGLDPVKASTDLDRFPEETHRQLIPRIAWAWSQRDPQAAANWADSIPEGAARDQAIREANWSIVSADPQRAFSLASTVGDQSMRYGLVRDALKAWHQMDPDTAQQALTTITGLSEMERDYLKAELIHNAAVPDLVLPN